MNDPLIFPGLFLELGRSFHGLQLELVLLSPQRSKCVYSSQARSKYLSLSLFAFILNLWSVLPAAPTIWQILFYLFIKTRYGLLRVLWISLSRLVYILNLSVSCFFSDCLMYLLTMWLTVSSFSSHNLHFCVLSIFALRWLVLMVLLLLLYASFSHHF